jgi:hypothetical protein
VVVDQRRHLSTGGVDVGYAEAVVVDESKVVGREDGHEGE